MAYVVSSTEPEQVRTSSSTVVTIPPDAQAGDLVIFTIHQRVTATLTETSGYSWTKLYQSAGGKRAATFAKIIGSSEPNPTFSGANYVFCIVATVVRGANMAVFAGVVQWASGVDTATLPSYVTTGNNALILHTFADRYNTIFYPDKVYCGRSLDGEGNNYVYKEVVTTSGTTIPSVTINTTGSTGTGASGEYHMLEIPDNGSGYVDVDMTDKVQVLVDLANVKSSTYSASLTAPSSIASTIGGFNTDTAVATFTASGNNSSTWAFGNIGLTCNNTSYPTQTFVGYVASVSWGPRDLSNACIIQSVRSSSTVRYGTAGFVLVLIDSLGNWVAYQITGNIQGASTDYWGMVKPGVTAEYDSSLAQGGTAVDLTDITNVGYLMHRSTFANSATVISVGLTGVIDNLVFVGGGAENPITSYKVLMTQNYTDSESTGVPYPFLMDFQGVGQLLAKTPLQFGDGSRKTYVKLQKNSFETPSSRQARWLLGQNDIDVRVKLSAACTFDASATLIVTDSRQSFTLDPATSTSATYTFAGTSFAGWDVTWKTGVLCNSATFSSCYDVDMKGADCTNVTFTNPQSTAAVTFTESGATLDGCTTDVTGTSADYHISLGASVTSITLTDHTFTGTAAVNKVYVGATTGTVTITTAGSTVLIPTDVTSAGATVNIVGEATYQSVTINNVVVGSRVQIYDTTNNLELKNEIATGTSVSWTDTVAAAAGRDIRVRIAYVSGTTAKQFIEANIGTCGVTTTTAGVTYLANQLTDSVYNANGIDGSTVTTVSFVDSSPDRVEINVATSLSISHIYAAWVYYAFTATGIATDIDYIRAIDGANYEFSNMVIKNTSSPSVPLKLIDGYLWDVTTGDPMDCIDTSGGTIFLAPPHVVVKTITLSGSNVITGDIDDVTAKVQAGLSAQGLTTSKVDSLLTTGKFLGLK